MTKLSFSVSKAFRFEAAHSLPHLPKDHKCHKLHGHSYEVVITVSGPVKNEWVQDYAEISAAWKPIYDRLDHQNLDDILLYPTTAENIAQWLWDRLEEVLPMLSRIELRETATTNVIVERCKD